MTQQQALLNLAMNLNRIGNWISDDPKEKRNRIETFLKQNNELMHKIDKESLPIQIYKPYKKFLIFYPTIEKQLYSNNSKNLQLAETLMTWGNILTHRAVFLKN